MARFSQSKSQLLHGLKLTLSALDDKRLSSNQNTALRKRLKQRIRALEEKGVRVPAYVTPERDPWRQEDDDEPN